MQVIALVNSKGGVGKTSLARALAVIATGREGGPKTPKWRVALVDLDPQKTLHGWFDRRERTLAAGDDADRNPDLLRDNLSAADAVDRLRQSGLYDVAIIDAPPAFLEEMQEVLGEADVALLPTLPDLDNVAATRDAVVLAKKALVQFAVVINRAPAGTKQVDMIKEMLRKAGVPVAATVIGDRVAYSQAHDVGLAAHELKSSASKAAGGDLQALWAEVLQMLAESRKAAALKVAVND